jgi:SAM-dependent methyltransferase
MDLPFSNMQIQHWNPGATMPLVLPIANFSNTDDEHVYANIKVNSADPTRRWLVASPEHKGIAILVGSGPSLRDSLPEIKEWASKGAGIFALNGAASFLVANGVRPQYQVILDARPQSAELVEPEAVEHLFCSQCDPATFARAPKAVLWHIAYEKLEEQFPPAHVEGPHHNAYNQIGGGITVGMCAVNVAYVMGFRTFHLYGYDSSARETFTHAFYQPMNNGEPMALVKFNGKDYLTSFTMKLQAEKLPELLSVLEALGCTVHVHGYGLLPDIWNADPIEEREKYAQVWNEPAYRLHSPGEDAAPEFVQMCEVQQYHHVLDLGCGTGRGGGKIFALADCKVTLLDFAANCLDEPIQKLLGIWQSVGRFRFIEADLSHPIPVQGDYGFCCDVLEHLPPSQVDQVIRNCLMAAPTCYFQVSTVPDQMGQLITRRLHLSVHPFQWWKDTFRRLGYAVRFSEDRGNAGVYLVSIP